MSRFWKIISFPVRLVLFLAVGLIAGVISLLYCTLGKILLYASAFIAVLATILCVLWLIPSAIFIFIMVRENDFTLENFWYPVICLAVVFILLFLLRYIPYVVEYINIALAVAAEYVWRFAKMIIKCDVCELVC